MQYRNQKSSRGRLNRQVEQSKFDAIEYGIDAIRARSRQDQLVAMTSYDGLDRHITKNWKAFRKTQWK